jgi:hypothetical protein
MTSLIGWLLGSSSVPAGPLVWVTGGLTTAIGLTALLLTTVGILIWQHEPVRRVMSPGSGRVLPRSTTPHSRVPSAA